MKHLIQPWAEAIKQAQIAANQADTGEDGGTCNLDAVKINFTGWRRKAIDQLAEMAGVSISDKLTSWMHKGDCLIGFNLHGQGNNRSRMAEAACKSLKAAGLPAHMWYQMD